MHPNPVRLLAYAGLSDARVFGLAGITNELQVMPAAGASTDTVKRALFALPGVAGRAGARRGAAGHQRPA